MDPPSQVSKIPVFDTLHVNLASEEGTLEFGKGLGRLLLGGDTLALTGDLGAGKTLLTRGIAQGLGIPANQVNSPTFTLIQAYDSPIPVIHVDLYRLESSAEIWQLGLEDYFNEKNIVIIEWADRCLQALPPDYLGLHLEHGATETTRNLTIQPTGPRSQTIATVLRSHIA